MLEFFRRHRGPFLITITVIIILAFGVWGAITGADTNLSNDPYSRAGQKAMTIYGTDYTQQDMARLSRNLQLAYSLGLYDLAFVLPDLAARTRDIKGGPPTADFVANLLVLREQALKHGIAASDEDARKAFEALQPLQKDGKFDPAQAETYLNNLRANGFLVTDVMELLKDKITLEKLREVVGANYVASPLEVEKSYAAEQQTLRGATITLALEDFKKKVQLKDEEISKYFDEKKDTFQTVEKRSAQYVVFEKPKHDEAVTADVNAKIEADWLLIVDSFYKKFSDPAADFTKLVAEANAEIATKLKKPDPKPAEAAPKADDKKAGDKKDDAKKPEEKPKTPTPVPPVKLEVVNLIEQENAPEPLKSEPEILKELFRHNLAVGKPSDPVDTTKGHAFLKVTKIEAPRQQELKEVKDKIKETLTAQKAKEDMAKAAKEARTAIADGLKAGKKLEDLAKEKSLKLATLPEFSASAPPADNPNGQQIADAAKKTAVNSVSDPVTTDSGEILVVVTSKELRKSDTSAAQKDGQRSSLSSRGQEALFKAWFGKLRDEAKMELNLDNSGASGNS